MSRKLTPLEALNYLVLDIRHYDYGFVSKEDHECIDTIETALKEWQLWKDNLEVGDIETKELKALEIINKKEVNVRLFKECKTRKEYNGEVRDLYYQRLCLTQEEYDLLKEVLLNG